MTAGGHKSGWYGFSSLASCWNAAVGRSSRAYGWPLVVRSCLVCVGLLKESPHGGQALEERKEANAKSRTLQGCLLAAKEGADAAEAERALLLAAHRNIQSVRFMARRLMVSACVLYL